MTSTPQAVLGIEARGIEPVPDAERGGRPIGLFWLWFAAAIGILGVTYGFALVTFSGLNLWQVLIAVILGAGLSGAFLGVLSVAGKRGGAPALTLSRAVFGPRGNIGPTVVSWLGFVGWETVMCTTAAYALLQIFALLGIDGTPVATTACVLVVIAAAATIGLFGHTTILFVQKWLTWIFGGVTVVVIGLLLPGVRWDLVMSQPAAPMAAVVGGIGFIAAGTGLGWLSAGADYARYLPRRTNGNRVVVATALGGLIPITVLVALGALLAVGDEALASANDPVAAIGAALPSWLLVPYLVTAVAGLITGADLSMYSSGLNVISAGVPVRRTTAVAIDAMLITLGALYITVMAQDFFGPFIAFLTVLAIPLTSWAVVFALDMIHRVDYGGDALMDTTAAGPYWYTRGVRWPAVIAWAAGIVFGLAFTTVTIGSFTFHGVLAGTWFGENRVAWLGGGLVAGTIFGAYVVATRHRRRSAIVPEEMRAE